MKMNNLKFFYDATTHINATIANIEKAESYEKAKKISNYAIGFVDCMIVYMNSMIYKENNDFTEELHETLDLITSKIYQALAEKAIETKQDNDEIAKILRMRDDYKEGK